MPLVEPMLLERPKVGLSINRPLCILGGFHTGSLGQNRNMKDWQCESCTGRPNCELWRDSRKCESNSDSGMHSFGK